MKGVLISYVLIFCVASFATETDMTRSKTVTPKQAFLRVADFIKDRKTAELESYLRELANLEMSSDVLNLDGHGTGLRAIHLACL